MEGYFSIKSYCELANVSTDTAYHRARRNEIPSFTDENGRQFLYFTDEFPGIPEGFISMIEFAEQRKMSYNTVGRLIKKNIIEDKDVFRTKRQFQNGKMLSAIYINKNTIIDEPRQRIQEAILRKMNKLRPDGCLTVQEFADAAKVPKYTVYYRIKTRQIPSVINCGHTYIHGIFLDDFKKENINGGAKG